MQSSLVVKYRRCMETTASRQRGNDPGPTAAEVARNISRVRFARNMTQQALSDRMAELGRPIPTSSIGKIESGLRTVDVDDLMALAAALDVSPLGLLLPRTGSPEDELEATGAQGKAEILWLWGTGYSSPKSESVPQGQQRKQANDFVDVSLPRWLETFPVITRLPAGSPEGGVTYPMFVRVDLGADPADG